MLNTHHTPLSRNVFSQQSYSPNGQQPLGGVRQDKGAASRARTASHQPAPLKKVMRPHRLNTLSARSQNRPSTKRKTVHLTLWVKPVVKAELERIAAREGLSVSATGGTFLEKALQQNIDMQYSALLQPIIESAISKQMRSYSTRIALLLVRVAFASEQTRSLVTNLLSRHPGITTKDLAEILDGSSKAAKSKITRKTPQLETVIADVERWFAEREAEMNG